MSSDSHTAAVVERFQTVLDRLRPGPQEVFDESALADSKRAIEAALVAVVRGDANVDVSPQNVPGWLAALAQFQSGLGTDIRDPASEVARRMTAARDRGERLDTRAIQADVDAAAKAEKWSARRIQHSHAVDKERDRLLGLLAGS